MPHLIHVRRVRGTRTGLYWLAFTEPAGLIERISKHYGDSQKVLRHLRQKLRDRLPAREIFGPTSRRSAAEGRGGVFHPVPACGGWIDCRDLACVFDHEGPLPHPAQDRPQ
jgi:hypothetical protein